MHTLFRENKGKFVLFASCKLNNVDTAMIAGHPWDHQLTQHLFVHVCTTIHSLDKPGTHILWFYYHGGWRDSFCGVKRKDGLPTTFENVAQNFGYTILHASWKLSVPDNLLAQITSTR